MQSSDRPGRFTVKARKNGRMIHNAGCASKAEADKLARAWTEEGLTVEVIEGKLPGD